MQFKVPQYIEVEDKVFGPFTIKQFIYVVGAAGASYVLWILLPSLVAIFFIIPIAGFAWALAFFPKAKYGKSFASLVESAFSYVTSSHLYTWKKVPKKISEDDDTEIILKSHEVGFNLPEVSQSKLKDLAWNLDVASGESTIEGEDPIKHGGKLEL